jgi:hypothetical protein
LRIPLRTLTSGWLVIVLFGCAQGGDTVLPQAQVKLSANHNIWTMSTPRVFSDFPIPATESLEFSGTLLMRDDSKYEVELMGAAGTTDSYALRSSGELSIFATPTNGSAIQYLGAYGLAGDTGVYFFTDRFATKPSDAISFFWGTRISAAAPDLTGDWHVFTQHVIHATSQTLNPNNVGRTLAGTLHIDAAAAVTGDGAESTKAAIELSGTAPSFADGRVNLSLDFQDAQSTDHREFKCSAATATGQTKPHVVLGLDSDLSDGEAGLVALIAERDRGTPADPTQLAGKYYFGMQTIFVDAAHPGADIAAGVLEFSATGFNLEGVGAGNIDFTYTGTYTLADDGTIDLTVSGTNETWKGAVDQEYKTVVIADNFIEARPAAKLPELNLLIGIRQVPPAQ